MDKALMAILIDHINTHTYVTVGRAIAEYGEQAGAVLVYLAKCGLLTPHHSSYPADVDPNPSVVVWQGEGRAVAFSRGAGIARADWAMRAGEVN